MQKIWIINQFANTPDLPGHTRQHDVSQYLSKNGFEVELFASDFNLSQRKFRKLNKFNFFLIEKVELVKWYWIRVFPYDRNDWRRKINMISFCINLFFILFLKCFFNLIIGNKKIIILASSPQLPAAYFSLIIAKLFRQKFILEVRDLWPQMLLDQGGMSKKSLTFKILLFMERQLYKSSEKIIILAKGMKNHIKEIGGNNIIWLPNGPDLNNFKFSLLPEDSSIFSKKRPLKLIYTGAHGESNDLQNVICAAKILKDLPVLFIFVGDGPEKKSLIKASFGMKNVKFIDPVPKNEIPKMLNSSDATLISLKNTKLFSYGVSPNKLYDSYAIGRPVITNIPGNINDEVEKYKLGFTSIPGNPFALAKAIKKLLASSKSDREEMGKNARKLAEKTYSREITNKKYAKLLFDLYINKVCKIIVK